MTMRQSAGTKILLAENDIESPTIMEIALKKNNYQVVTVDSVSSAREHLKYDDFDLIVTDYNMADGNGLDLLNEAQQSQHEIAVIILCAFDSIKDSDEMVKRGVLHYLARPFETEELLLLVERAIESRNMREELNNLREEIAWKYGFDCIVGASVQMMKLKTLASRVAATDISILITGESGTGKEMMAKTIHFHSSRRKNKFIPIDCTSIPADNLESELFGHIKGSFKSAFSDYMGLFEQADGGTVFLDRIGEIPVNLQAKILRVLENSEIHPVGSDESRKIDVRIIAASNRNLSELVKEGCLREDLYYRLNVMPLNTPSLKERTEDIATLIEYFIRSENADRDGDKISISTEAMEKLMNHNWPGNVRELKNTIKRGIALCQENRITKSDIMFISTGQQSRSKITRIELSGNAEMTLEESLKERIESTLNATNWNYTRTASKLGIGRTTLWRKVRKYNITRGEEIAETITDKV